MFKLNGVYFGIYPGKYTPILNGEPNGKEILGLYSG